MNPARLFSKRKIAFVTLFFFLASLLVARSIQAFYTPNASYQFQFEQAVYKSPQEMNLQSFVYETMKATAGSVATTLTGCLTCGEAEKRDNPGLLVMTGGLIANIYANPPASGVQYLADIGRRLDLVPPAYAQDGGLGFEAMKLVLPIWKAFRDISYVFFVLIFVALGFAIMFRVKISPQAIITIQSALPRIIIALLLITFSYAIAGFLIDLMVILCLLIAGVFRDILVDRIAEVVPIAGPLLQRIKELFENFFGPYAAATATIQAYAMGAMFTTFLTAVLLTIAGVPLGALVGAGIGAFGGPVTAGAGATVGALAGPIFAIIILLILLIIYIRCLWVLLKAFIGVILGIVFAPLQILVGVLPGSNTISDWFKNLIANLAVLPLMLTMFLLASFFSFTWIFQLVQILSSGPFGLPVGDIITALGALGARDLVPFTNLLIEAGAEGLTFFITPFIGLGILFMAPKAAEIIQSFITRKPFAYGTAIGEAFGPAKYAAMLGIAGGTRVVTEEGRLSRRPWRQLVEGVSEAAQRTLTGGRR